MKALFDMINRSPSLEVLITDLCQNVLSAIAETTRFLELPVVRCKKTENFIEQNHFPISDLVHGK